jgi:hypothetical protein
VLNLLYGTTCNAQSISNQALFATTPCAQNPLRKLSAKYKIFNSDLTQNKPDNVDLQGDSGGPGVIYDSDGNPTLACTASFVAALGCPGYPNGLVRVENFLPWILLNVEGYYEN